MSTALEEAKYALSIGASLTYESMYALIQEKDELEPLLFAIEEYHRQGTGMHTNDGRWMERRRAEKEVVRKKAKQYGDYKALWGIMSEAELVITDDKLLLEYENQYKLAKEAYFGADGTG